MTELKKEQENFETKKSYPKKNNNGLKEGYSHKVVNLKRISKTTKGGRRMRFSVLVIVGNKKGNVGYAMAKSLEIPVASQKAIASAQKMAEKTHVKTKWFVKGQPDEGMTIFHEVEAKNGASKVLLKPASKGTGIIAGGAIRNVLEMAGFTDIMSKNMGSNATVNMIQTTIDALLKQRTPHEIYTLRDKTVSGISKGEAK